VQASREVSKLRATIEEKEDDVLKLRSTVDWYVTCIHVYMYTYTIIDTIIHIYTLIHTYCTYTAYTHIPHIPHIGRTTAFWSWSRR
jgi:hypothetical protein